MITALIIILAIIGFIVLITIGWIIGNYNEFINSKVSIETQWSNIKTEYQRRADLFYNLVQSVKSHMKFEKGTLIEVTKMRNANLGSPSPESLSKMKGMDAFFSKLIATFEAYPNLKSIEQYNRFTEEIRITEDRINIARTDLNDIIREYNINVRSFPTNILAKMFGFTKEKFYINEEKTNYAPKVDFEAEKVVSFSPH